MQCVCFQVHEHPGARFPHPWHGRSRFHEPCRQEFTLCLRTSTGRPSSSTAGRLRRPLGRMSSLRPRERYGRMVVWVPRKTSRYFPTCRQSIPSADDITCWLCSFASFCCNMISYWDVALLDRDESLKCVVFKTYRPDRDLVSYPK